MSFARPINVLRRAGKARQGLQAYTVRKYAKTFVQIVCNFPFGCRKFAKLVLCITVLYKTHIALAKGLLHFSQCIYRH